jgi:hypothetical protein
MKPSCTLSTSFLPSINENDMVDFRKLDRAMSTRNEQMRNRTALYMLLIVLGLTTEPVLATGFVDLSATGLNVNDGTIAYTLCNATAKPGEKRIKTTPARHNACAVFPASEVTAPLDGFSIVTHAVRTATMNNIYTDGVDKKVATVTEFVWRNSSQTECIYGARVMTLLGKDADYDTKKSGNQYFKISDFARGGFSGLPVSVAYFPYAATAEPVYSIGRALTTVQHHNTNGHPEQSLSTADFKHPINGINTENATHPAQDQPSEALNDDWVNFTSAIGLPKRPASAVFYVKTRCSSAAPETVPDAIRLRQTSPPFIEISVPGFAPPGGVVRPAQVMPF